MFLRCQNHLTKNTPKIQVGGQESPQIQDPMIPATYVYPMWDWDQHIS